MTDRRKLRVECSTKMKHPYESVCVGVIKTHLRRHVYFGLHNHGARVFTCYPPLNANLVLIFRFHSPLSTSGGDDLDPHIEHPRAKETWNLQYTLRVFLRVRLNVRNKALLVSSTLRTRLMPRGGDVGNLAFSSTTER